MSKKYLSRWNPTIVAPSMAPAAEIEPARSQLLAAQVMADGIWEAPTIPSAVLVFHGIGEEVRFETLSRAASLILTEAEERKATNISVVIRSVPQDKDASGLASRIELKWLDEDGNCRQVHVYEAYWAPLTMGKVSYTETVQFLAAAGWNGLRGTFLSGKFGYFRRWLFGEFRELKTTLGTLPLLAVLLFLIGFVAAMIAMAAASAAGFVKCVGEGGWTGFVDAANFVYGQVANPWNWSVAHIATLLEGIGWLQAAAWMGRIVFNAVLSWAYWWQAALAAAVWCVLIRAAFKCRYYLTQYAGSLAAYLSPYKDSAYEELRHQIQQVGLDAATLIYEGCAWPGGWIPKYEKIVLLGHSLGSVIAYDTLNVMINLEAARNQAGAANTVVERTKTLITFGSPLDKTAFLFRVQLDAGRNRFDEEGELRETMVCAVQPLIASYDNRFDADREPHGTKWINLWSPMDIISGRLDYYDDPAVDKNAPKRIENKIDWRAWIPIAAHTQYWRKNLLRKTIYDELF